MSDISLRAVAISAGDNHTCALQADGKLRCIGANESGQLGVGNLQPSIRWTRTKETGGDGRKREVVVSSVALGGNACAVIADAMSEKAEGA